MTSWDHQERCSLWRADYYLWYWKVYRDDSLIWRLSTRLPFLIKLYRKDNMHTWATPAVLSRSKHQFCLHLCCLLAIVSRAVRCQRERASGYISSFHRPSVFSNDSVFVTPKSVKKTRLHWVSSNCSRVHCGVWGSWGDVWKSSLLEGRTSKI